jgi:hypothetical protein
MAEAEPNGTRSLANVARDLPFQCAGTISAPGDVDYTCVAVTEGQRVEADVFGRFGNLESPLDPYLTVYTSDGTPIGSNDDVEPSNDNACVIFEAPYTGTVYFATRAAGPQGSAECEYVLAVWPITVGVFAPEAEEVEPNGGPTEARQITLPGIMRGCIGESGDADWVRFEAPGLSTLVVDLHSQSYDLPLDAVVELYDRDGQKCWKSDDMDGADPRFNVGLPLPGVYSLRVTGHAESGADCAYILSVSLQDATGIPILGRLWFNIVGSIWYLKKVEGSGMDPAEVKVEVNGTVVPSVPSPKKPDTVVKVKPPAAIRRGVWVTLLNPDGRRSNTFVPVPRG